MLWAKRYKLLTLKNYEDQFLYYINKFSKELTRYDDIKWFDVNTNWCLQKTYKNYLDWTFVVTDDDEEELIAFAAVQDFNNGVARILTRLYYNPKYRRKNIRYESNELTPGNVIAKHQVDNFHFMKHLFFSVEYIYRRPTIIKLGKKLNKFYGHQWNTLPDLYKTYNKDEKGAWQSVIAYSFLEEQFPLEHITLLDWKEKYDR
jgi:hypothetical protein